jgi:hypothetical protein
MGLAGDSRSRAFWFLLPARHTLGHQVSEEFRSMLQSDLSGTKKAKKQKQQQVRFSLDQAKTAKSYCDHATHIKIVECLFGRIQDNAQRVKFDLKGNVLEQQLGSSLETVAAEHRGFEIRFQVGGPAHAALPAPPLPGVALTHSDVASCSLLRRPTP